MYRWNMRVLERPNGMYELLECFYDEEENIIDYCPALPKSDTLQGLIKDIQDMVDDARDCIECDMILTEDDLPTFSK